MKKYSLITGLSVLILVLSGLSANAQTSGDWLENTMLTSGKINVVVAVVAVVFVLLVIYLFSIDWKLRQMEKNETKNQ